MPHVTTRRGARRLEGKSCGEATPGEGWGRSLAGRPAAHGYGGVWFSRLSTHKTCKRTCRFPAGLNRGTMEFRDSERSARFAELGWIELLVWNSRAPCCEFMNRSAARTPGAPMARRIRRVLIVEDDKPLSAAIWRAAQKWGDEVVIANSLAEARARAATSTHN